jgi:hypothetical protein
MNAIHCSGRERSLHVPRHAVRSRGAFPARFIEEGPRTRCNAVGGRIACLCSLRDLCGDQKPVSGDRIPRRVPDFCESHPEGVHFKAMLADKHMRQLNCRCFLAGCGTILDRLAQEGRYVVVLGLSRSDDLRLPV